MTHDLFYRQLVTNPAVCNHYTVKTTCCSHGRVVNAENDFKIKELW